ncbi:MAG: Hsp70 family protein [Myxococcales bacterium]|nr:Hsp70 family protein [Myxococcales bacterium]
MSEPKEKTPVGTIAPRQVVLRTRCATPEELVERYYRRALERGFLFENPKDYPPGTEVRLFVQLADGQTAISGRGVVASAPEGSELGFAVRFRSMSAKTRTLLEAMLARHKSAGTESNAVADAGLERSLRRMVLVAGDSAIRPPMARRGKGHAGPIIGIDLGTTNTCCAVVKNGRPLVIPSRRGHNTVPSVVAVNPVGEVLVGHAARSQMEINPERTIYGSKRLIGRPFASPVVRQVRDRFHYRIVEGPRREAAVQIGERQFSLEEVASKILEEIRAIAQDYLGTLVQRAVITVPANYNENQRQAVCRAGELAGLQVERIINEPTAAALAYGYNRQIDQKVLIYDLGGGTFDASVLNLYGNVYEVVATGGDTFLGGLDFDTQLADHVLMEFQRSLGKLPHMERVAFLRVLQGAEFAKIALSDASTARISLPFIGTVDGKPVSLEQTVNRETLEELSRPLIARTLKVCDQVLARAHLNAASIDQILLVGAQTRMPLVWRMIHEHFGKEPLKGVHPDESVALGAALLAESLDKLDAVVLIDVLPMSIGVGVPGGSFRRILEAGTPLPASRTFGLFTYQDDQREMVLPVFQGENAKVDDNEFLGAVHMTGIPPGPAGKRMIEVTFGLSPECLLTVAARDREGAALCEVIMSTKETPTELRSRLGLIEPPSAPKPPASPPEVPGAAPACAPECPPPRPSAATPARVATPSAQPHASTASPPRLVAKQDKSQCKGLLRRLLGIFKPRE